MTMQYVEMFSQNIAVRCNKETFSTQDIGCF